MSQEITKEQIAALTPVSAPCANRGHERRDEQRPAGFRHPPRAVEQDVHEYSISLEQGEICNQKQSGRCWMFAALNPCAIQVMKNNLKTFELSQAYLFFWDKLEKSTTSSSILDTLDRPPMAVWCPIC